MAIVFGIGIAAAAIGIIVVQIQARNANKERERERLALLGGYTPKGKDRAFADVEASRPYTQRNPSEANMPLIAPGGTQQFQQYNAPDVSPHDAPRLHPGLEALGQGQSR